VANTAIGVSEALKLGPLAAPAGVAYALAVGAAQLAALSSASKGGGSISAPEGSGVTDTQPALQDNIVLSNAGQNEIGEGLASGASFQLQGSGDEFLDFLAGAINEGQRQGKIQITPQGI
jgi:hypothetical protein